LSRVVRSRAAARDLRQIWDYIAEDDPAAADRVLSRIEDRALVHADFPQSGSLRSELGGARSFAVGNYLIFYRPIPDGIRLLRVLNASRDIRKAFHR
jgi:toxin ParE1/3/4